MAKVFDPLSERSLTTTSAAFRAYGPIPDAPPQGQRLKRNAATGSANPNGSLTQDLAARDVPAHETPANDIGPESHPGTASDFIRPNDWPTDGPIDLELHDPPHASSSLEWWYINTQLELQDGKRVGVFAAFFRKAADEHLSEHTHSLAWGISDPARGRSLSKVVVDGLAPEVGLRNLDLGLKDDDERIQRALREVLTKGQVPKPTRQLDTLPVTADVGLMLDYGGDRLSKDPRTGEYSLALSDPDQGIACELRLKLQKEPVRYGDGGVVNGVGGETMFYYFVPRASVTGSVTLDGRKQEVIQGSGWYDHEFGAKV